MTKKYLVTGCAGFICSRVTEMLLEAGHVVVGVDNLNDAYDPRLKHWRLARLQGRERFQFHQLDISDIDAMQRLFQSQADSVEDKSIEEKPFSAVVNLAARAGVASIGGKSLGLLSSQLHWNAQSVGDVPDSWREKVSHGIHFESLRRHNKIPFSENDDTNRVLSPYAASKKAAEVLAYTYHYLHGLDISIPRYFTVYGPAGRPDMSIFRFIRRIAEGEPLTLFGDGSQSRILHTLTISHGAR